MQMEMFDSSDELTRRRAREDYKRLEERRAAWNRGQTIKIGLAWVAMVSIVAFVGFLIIMLTRW